MKKHRNIPEEANFGCSNFLIFTINASDACGNTATANVVYAWTTATLRLPSGGYLGCNPTNLPTDASVKAGVIASDSCSTAKATVSHTDSTSGCITTRTFTIDASDTCGDTARGTAVYTWTTATLTISGKPTGGGLGCNPTNLPTVASVSNAVTLADSCSAATYFVTTEDTIDGCTTTRTFTINATDACGDTATATAKYTWKTATLAITGLPSGGDLGCNPTNLPTNPDVKAGVTTSDACSTATVNVSHEDTSNGCTTIRIFTITATDDCADTATAYVTNTWKTATLTISGKPTGGGLGCNPTNLPTVTSVSNAVTLADSCSAATYFVTSEDTIDGCTTTRTFTINASDACGDTATATVKYTWKTATLAITGLPSGGDLGCNPTNLPTNPDVKTGVTTSDACSTATVSVSHQDTTSGCATTRTFTITATDDCNNSTSATVTYTWATAATPEILASDSVCADSAGNTASGPAGESGYLWQITGGFLTSGSVSPTVTYTAGNYPGNVVLTLTITNACGCTAQSSKTILINPAPATPTITLNPTSVRPNSTKNTASGPAGASCFDWAITGGAITAGAHAQTVTYTAGASNDVVLTLTVCNTNGCTATNSATVPLNLSGENLQGANLQGANLQGANLAGADLSDANLLDANLSNANLQNADLSDAILENASLAGALLSGANLAEADLQGAGAQKANFANANLSDALLENTILSGAGFSAANLAGADLQGANLANTDFTDAILPAANLLQTTITGAVFTDANTSGCDGCPTVVLSAGPAAASSMDPTNLLSALRIINVGPLTASNLTVTAITDPSNTLTSPALPFSLGTVGSGDSAVLNADFSGGPFIVGQSYTFTVAGTYSVLAATDSFTINVTVSVPPAAGSNTVNTVTVGANYTTGAPFPHRTPVDFDEVNEARPPVPTAPGVSRPPTTPPTVTQVAPIGDPPAIDFVANNGLETNSPWTPTEPSGDNSPEGVVFLSANSFVSYSTDGGSTFTGVDLSTIFPSTPIGPYCDQIVQYVPSIDLFDWLAQGTNGYILAVASPADISSSGGTSWTYWNLTTELFGQPVGTGFDYPDLSVGDNYLYICWDAGSPNCPTGCTGGHQVARTSLAGLKAAYAGLIAGGTIDIDFTDPADGFGAWMAHLTQDTGDQILWAGQKDTSDMWVFSWAEDSDTYFWQQIAVSLWSNTGESSTTPDNNDWLSKLGSGAPGNAVLGATRAGNQLWFAWTAGTDSNFKQPHVEMVELDLNNNFNVLQQVQIWNNDYAFAYPSLATTSACGGQVGLALEYGGGVNYENFVVGFWGDYVVYITVIRS